MTSSYFKVFYVEAIKADIPFSHDGGSYFRLTVRVTTKAIPYAAVF
jgi:hypothetical protein